MDNAMSRANMENAVNAALNTGSHDLRAHLGDLAKENRGLSYQIRDNLFGPILTEGDSCEKAIGCAKDAIEDAIDLLVEANNILRYVVNRL